MVDKLSFECSLCTMAMVVTDEASHDSNSTYFSISELHVAGIASDERQLTDRFQFRQEMLGMSLDQQSLDC